MSAPPVTTRAARPSAGDPRGPTPTVVHLTTVDMSLALLLLPQLIGLREAGYDVVGVSGDGPYVAMLEAHGIRHVPLPRSTRSADLRADLVAARGFLGICRALRPTIVHTHNPKPGIYGRLVARAAGVPHVVNTVHGLYATTDDRWAKRAAVYGLERGAGLCSDAELVQNPEDLAVLRRLAAPERKLHLLGNGVDLARFDPVLLADARQQVRTELRIADGEVVVGLVGRLVREKGYREVFEAARHVRAAHPEVRFVVVGPQDPDKPDALTGRELAHAADAGVRFLGSRHDVERLYAAMDLYVLASHREGFPRSAMEAAAMGRAVVATDIRGCRQVVDPGRTGLLVGARDARALAEAIAALVEDRPRREAMGRAGRRKAIAQFDDRRQIAVILDVYERLLAHGDDVPRRRAAAAARTVPGQGRATRPRR